MQRERLPELLRPFEALGFSYAGITGNEYYGDCPLCGRAGKFYVNKGTGQFNCKSGSCEAAGNVYSFIQKWMDMQYKSPVGIHGASQQQWDDLSEERGIRADKLMEAGVVWDGERWVLPVRNAKGSIINLRFYRPGTKMRGLPNMEVGLFGHEKLEDDDRSHEAVYLCEGEWDAIALEQLLEMSGEPGVVVGVPGTGVLKDGWVEDFRDRRVVLVYDNDLAGKKGIRRAERKLRKIAKSIRMVDWPEAAPEGMDVRDFLRAGGTYGDFQTLIVDYRNLLGEEESPQRDEETPGRTVADFPPFSPESRPTFRETLKIYKKWLLMTPEMVDGLRVIFSVVISNQLSGDPLWVHVCAPAGRGKTELLMSTSEVANVMTRSTVTPHSLISGYELPGGKDPSLIPKLFGNTFVVKDFTEILSMHVASKQELYNILRGAFDGRCEKQFGNKVGLRTYKGYFSMVTGVTHAIYGERGAALGERFVIFRMGAHRKGEDDDTDVIMAALSTQGDEVAQMKKELAEAATAFLEWRFSPEDIPVLDRSTLLRIASLAQLVSMLRSAVEKDHVRDVLIYRPEHEVGTRLAKQLAKLAICLALQNTPPRVDNEVMRIVTECAIHSCVAWNLDTLMQLAIKDGRTVSELSESADIPQTTLREHLEQLTILGVLKKELEPPMWRGRSVARYWMSPQIRRHWQNAGLAITPLSPEKEEHVKKLQTAPGKMRIRRSKNDHD